MACEETNKKKKKKSKRKKYICYTRCHETYTIYSQLVYIYSMPFSKIMLHRPYR